MHPTSRTQPELPALSGRSNNSNADNAEDDDHDGVELNQSSPLYQVDLVGVMLMMMGMVPMMMMVWNQSSGGLEDHHSDANE